MDQIDQAVHDLVHESEIPAKVIAARMGVSHQILLNKANPQSEFHKLTLREAVAIQLITGDNRIQRAVDVELGKNKKVINGKCLIESVIHTTVEHGDVVKTIHQSMSDKRFTLREKEKCQKEIDEAIDALTELRLAVNDQ